MGIVVILGGLLLVFAQKMRAESIASANRLSYDQADAVEQGAEQWVLAQVEEYGQDAVSLTNDVPAQGIQVGEGYFWVIRPNQDSNQDYDFGLVDESGKLNLNTATADELQELPNVPENLADAMMDWRTAEATATSDGAKTPYYESLPEPYDCKDAVYETPEELRLVSGMTPQILYGADTNRNGVIDPEEQAAESTGGVSLTYSSGDDIQRGIINFVTTFSQQTVRGRNVQGLVNVNTAPVQVLMCLPGMTEATAESVITARQGGTTSGDTSWFRSAVGQGIYGQLSSLIATTSYQYSADIVAVSGDGRSFKRVQIVVDVRSTPASIVYRRDLTSLGWPLPQAIRDSLRSGQGVPAEYSDSSASLSGGNPLNP